MRMVLPASPAHESILLVSADDLVPDDVRGSSEHPVAVHLARLAPRSRRSQAAAVETMGRLLASDRVGADKLSWSDLRYQHTQALRSALAERAVAQPWPTATLPPFVGS